MLWGGVSEQIGCRLLQLKLDQGDPVFVNKICGEAQPYLAEMMKVRIVMKYLSMLCVTRREVFHAAVRVSSKIGQANTPQQPYAGVYASYDEVEMSMCKGDHPRYRQCFDRGYFLVKLGKRVSSIVDQGRGV